MIFCSRSGWKVKDRYKKGVSPFFKLICIWEVMVKEIERGFRYHEDIRKIYMPDK